MQASRQAAEIALAATHTWSKNCWAVVNAALVEYVKGGGEGCTLLGMPCQSPLVRGGEPAMPGAPLKLLPDATHPRLQAAAPTPVCVLLASCASLHFLRDFEWISGASMTPPREPPISPPPKALWSAH